MGFSDFSIWDGLPLLLACGEKKASVWLRMMDVGAVKYQFRMRLLGCGLDEEK